MGNMRRALRKTANLCLATLMLSGAVAEAEAATMLDLNTSSPEQLAHLEDAGFAPELVQALIQYRNKLGGFKSPADVRAVPGMGDEDFAALYPFALNGSIVVEVEMPPSMASY